MTSLLNKTIESQRALRNAASHNKVLQFKYATSTEAYAAMTVTSH